MDCHQPAPSLRRKLLRLVWHSLPFVVVLLIILVVILPLMKKINTQKADLNAQQASAVKEKRPPANVVTMEMVPGRIAEKLSLPGVVKPWVSLDVVAEITGKIVSKQAHEGMVVKKGDILAIIDQRDYQHNYDAALASWETAKTTEKRLKALTKKQFVTQSQLDDAIARVKTTRAGLDIAKLNLERCTIRSPMDGVVDRVYIEYGMFMDVGNPVAGILEIDRVKVEVGIPESDVDAVRRLTRFDMVIDGLDKKQVTGIYHYLYKTTDSMARLYSLEIQVDNPDYMILPDMFARVAIVKNQDMAGLAVPMYSLVTQNQQTGVFLEKDGKAAFQPVETGFQDGWKIQVKTGLSPGDQVVVVGQRLIEDGEDIHVAKTVTHMGELLQ